MLASQTLAANVSRGTQRPVIYLGLSRPRGFYPRFTSLAATALVPETKGVKMVPSLSHLTRAALALSEWCPLSVPPRTAACIQPAHPSRAFALADLPYHKYLHDDASPDRPRLYHRSRERSPNC